MAKSVLAVIDMQNDFIDGALGTKEAQAIVGNVAAYIEHSLASGEEVVYTRDTHFDNYLDTQEGKNLPVVHCIKGTNGWEIRDELRHFKMMAQEYLISSHSVLWSLLCILRR